MLELILAELSWACLQEKWCDALACSLLAASSRDGCLPCVPAAWLEQALLPS